MRCLPAAIVPHCMQVVNFEFVLRNTAQLSDGGIRLYCKFVFFVLGGKCLLCSILSLASALNVLHAGALRISH